MNKIIVLITPVEGHFNPFIPIKIKLVEKGHELVCITGRIFKHQVENTGASFIPVLEKWDPGENEEEYLEVLKMLYHMEYRL